MGAGGEENTLRAASLIILSAVNGRRAGLSDEFEVAAVFTYSRKDEKEEKKEE
jgi:hypothetical protein